MKILASILVAVALLFTVSVNLAIPAYASEEPFAKIKKIVAQVTEEKLHIRSGTVTAISGTTLTVTHGDKSYTINTNSKTKFKRRFWGDSSLSEISVGDKVNVVGVFTDNNKTTILAKWIRDVSIQKRHGTFFGTVSSKASDNFVLKSKNRGIQTVFINSGTEFIGRNNSPISYSDLEVGHRVRVKGVWDRKLNKIIELREVKDFSLLLKKDHE